MLPLAHVAVMAQAPAGYISVIQTKLLDSTGVPVASARVCATPVQGSVHLGTGGTTTQVPVCTQATNGAWSLNLPDGASTIPTLPAYKFTAIDDATQEDLLNNYNVVQPSSVAPTGSTSWWCSPTQCDFDNLAPNLPPQTVYEQGPPGPQGPPGASGGTGGGSSSVIYADDYIGTTCADYTTPVGCAFGAAKAKVIAQNINVPLVIGNGYYPKCEPWVQPTGFHKVDILGYTVQSSVLNEVCSHPTTPALLDPAGHDNPIFTMKDLTWNLNANASSGFDLLDGSQGGSIENVTVNLPATEAVSGSDHAFQIGSASSPYQNADLLKVTSGGAPFSVTSTMARLTPTGTTSLTGITVADPGGNYDPTYAVGFVNDPDQHCAGHEPAFTVTITAGSVSGTNITDPGVCDGITRTDTHSTFPELGVANQYPKTYGPKVYTTDGVVTDLTSSLGTIYMEGSLTEVKHAHPINLIHGLVAKNSNTYSSTECDTIHGDCIDVNGNAGMQFSGTFATTQYGIASGAVIYKFEPGAQNVYLNGAGSLCSGSAPPDYSLLTTVPYGRVTPYQYPQWPSNLEVTGYNGRCAWTGQTNQDGNTLAQLYTILPGESTYLLLYASVSQLIPYNAHPGAITWVTDGLDFNDCSHGGGTVMHPCQAGPNGWVPLPFPMGNFTGPTTAPTGSCSTIGWVFSQDGKGTFCNGTTWVSKI